MQGITTYLTFDGNGREAMKFYAECLHADLEAKTYAEGEVPCPDSEKNKLMHAKISKGTLSLMASDAITGMPLTQGNNFSIAIGCDSSKEIDSIFDAFSVDAKITMPLQETFWAERFGMLTDKFGINWMFNLDKKM